MRTKRALMILLFFGADAAWEAVGAFAGFTVLALLVLWVAMSVMSVSPSNPTAAKAASTEARLAQHIVATGPAVDAVANGGTLGGNSTIAGDLHVQGKLYGVSGTLTIGDTAQFTASGNGPTGSNTFLGLTNSQASFLAGLDQMSSEGSQSNDPNTGSSWASGERDYINNLVGAFNNLLSRLQDAGYMAS